MEVLDSIPSLHTLAQLARRAGISEGRARALYAEEKLPRADSKDADGRPLWLATTIDAWSRRRGRVPRAEVPWIYRSEDATEPSPELFHGIVEAQSHGRLLEMHAIVWDTPSGHVVYLAPLYDENGASIDATNETTAVAEFTAQLIKPAFWSKALVVQQVPLSFGDPEKTVLHWMYRLEFDDREGAPSFRRFGLHRQKSRASEYPTLRARFEGGWVPAEDLARVIGTPVPVWIRRTCTRDAVQRATAYTSTFTVPDTITGWTDALGRFEAARAEGMAERFPAAFSALAAELRATLEEVREGHARQVLHGPGWYVVARPALPELPISTEQVMVGAQPSEDLDAVSAELQELRRIEPDLSVDAPEGDALEVAIELLASQLRGPRPEIAIDFTTPYDDDFAGPVIDQWRQTLTEVDRNTALKTRRLGRLLSAGWTDDDVEQVLRDPAGRFVAVIRSHSRGKQLAFSAEWPYRLPTGWTDRTIIAADPGRGAVFALTPTDDGRLDVDPVPFERGTGPSFRYGYNGGSPFTLYQALIRCVFNGIEDAPFTLRHVTDDFSEDASQLWKAIVTTEGPLRLAWPQVQLWARADAKAAGYTPQGKRRTTKSRVN